MHEQDAPSNTKVIMLAAGGAALAALLVAIARRRDEDETEGRVEAVVEDAKKEAKKAAKAAKKKRKDLKQAVAHAGDRLGEELRTATGDLDFDAKAAERDLKAAAWDAQQQAREAESRLRAAGHRVVDDAAHLASRVGAEARNLAGEGRERFAHLRHREDDENAVDRELDRLRAEIDELRAQVASAGHRAEKDLGKRFRGKGRASKEAMASEAAAAALSQFEKSLRAKAPLLLAAKNRAQLLEILQRELGPTLRESGVQAATAALGMWEAARERGETGDEIRERARDFASEARGAAHEIREDARHAADAAKESAQFMEAARSNGKRRLWRSRHGEDLTDAAREMVDEAASHLTDEEQEEARRGKAGLLWGGAGLGLALYALLDPERREKMLQLANEASIQVQELVRDLQGYDDEF